jgi:hypothetical protein
MWYGTHSASVSFRARAIPDSSMICIPEVWNRDTRKHIAIALLVGLLLRLFIVIYLPTADADADLYKDLAQNLVEMHAYSYQPGTGVLLPTDARMPGYPLFLSAVYVFFGTSQRAILIAQVFVDLCTVLLVALLAASLSPAPLRKRVTIAAIWLAATCPFVANYASDSLPEVLATFFTTAAVLVLVWACQSEFAVTDPVTKPRPALLWFLGGVIVGLGSLVRPEVPITLAGPVVVLTVMWSKPANWMRLARTGLILGLGFVIPLLPWAARNWITLHKVEFLTARNFNMGNSFIPVGFYAWTHTWLVYSSQTETVMNRLENEPLNMSDIPSWAFDSAEERMHVEKLLQEQHNEYFQFSPQADAQFAALARERTARHPFRTYFTVPFERALSLWFTPRTELLPYEGRLWPPIERWRNDHLDFLTGVLFNALNFFYAGLALAGAYLFRQKPAIALIMVFIVVRTMFIAVSHYTVEPRFVIECVPAMLAIAALAWARRLRHEMSVV